MKNLFLPPLLMALAACAHKNVEFKTGDSPVRLVVQQTPEQRSKSEAQGKKHVIATQGIAATQAAEAIFEQGGNIIDAAVAASFAISVERPHSTGLAGGGFMVFRQAKTGKVFAIDFRERAPLKATEKMFLDAKGEVIPNLSINGILSVAVPGQVAGLTEIHKRFGKLPLKKVIQPAIDLAEKGFTVYPHLALALKEQKDVLAKYPSSAKIFLHADGSPYQLGETLVQKDLAETLRLIAKDGKKAFYKGKIAKAILAESKKWNGLLTQADFDKYRVKWREPVRGTYNGYEIFSMPPPSSGGTHVIEILNMLEQDHLRELGFQSLQSIHRTASAMQLAFADRAKFMGDPDFVKIPLDRLISKEYAKKQRARFDLSKHLPSDQVQAGDPAFSESNHTTHFSIIDSDGNMVASTQTINGFMGSSVVAEGTGLVLNNEMDDFSAKPGASNLFGAVGSTANAITPGKTPLSSMSPTLVLKNGKPVLAVGAPGGTRIINCTMQTILNFIEFGLPLYESVAALRFHHQWRPDVLKIDSPGPREDVTEGLKKMGYSLEIKPEAVGCRVMAAAVEGDVLHGVADPRDIGTSAGK